MNVTETGMVDRMRRVAHYGAANTELFPEGTLACRIFKLIGSVVAQAEKVAAVQDEENNSMETVTSKAIARALLYDDIEAIAFTARAISIDNPPLREKFRMPRHHNYQSLLDLARAFEEDVTPFEKDFLEHGMPDNFLLNLRSDIEAMGNSSSERFLNLKSNVGFDLEDSLERGLAALHKLDAIMRNMLLQKPGLLAEWFEARHDERSEIMAHDEIQLSQGAAM